MIGLLGGRALVTERPPLVATSAPPVAQRCRVALEGRDVDLIAHAIAREIGAPPAAAGTAPTPASIATPAEPEPASVSDDHGARDAALAVVERAVATGAWTDEDRLALRMALAQTPDADRKMALLAFARAVNDGNLRVIVRPPL